MTPEALAQRCAAQMWAGDHASHGMGMRLDAVSPGAARLSMTVADRHVNGFGICHGGYIFSLADSAFAFACNTTGEVSVAAHCDVFFLRPARLGETLVATAAERQREGRSGLYDVRVTTEAGETVAEFRGQSRTTGQRLDV